MSAFAQAELHSASGRHEQAARLYEQLAAAGDHKSQTRLAWMHEAGRGVVRDLAEAARRFQLAADGGDAQAQYALAVMYRTGQGKVQDAQASAHWLRRAAAQQYPPAVSALQSLDEQTAPR
jgi:uncharacterized protein